MKFRPPISAILFDMDGVLLDTEKIYTEVTQEYVAQFGKTFDWSVKANMVGRPAIEAAAYLIEALDLPISPEDYLAARKDHLLERMASAEAMPGAEELTRALCQAGVPLAVATSSDKRFFSQKTAHHAAWFALFEVIVTGDDPRIAAGKPAPDIFLLAATELKVDPAECLVIEDSPAGIEAGRAAGMQTLGVPAPGMDPEKLAQADQITSSLEKISPTDLGQ